MLTRDKYLSDSEMGSLLKTLDFLEPKYLRDVTLLRLLIETGARCSEILALKFSDISQDKTILIRGLKGSRDRELPIRDKLYNNLKKLKLETPDQSLVFDITYKRLFQIWQDYRPCKKGLHALRHSFAIKLYKKRKDIKLVQLALGHKSIANTQIYTDFLYSIKEMRRIL